MTAPHTAATLTPVDRKPRDDEIDFYGLTHPGKVRTENQDQFLISTLRKQMAVRMTSLPDPGQLGVSERLASLAMIADGVGGGNRGAEASRIALEAVARYVTSSVRCYYAADSADATGAANSSTCSDAEGGITSVASHAATSKGDPSAVLIAQPTKGTGTITDGARPASEAVAPTSL